MSENMKVFELAKELNLKALDLIDKIKPLDFKLKNHMADLTPEQVDKIKTFLNPPAAEAPKKKAVVRKEADEALAVDESPEATPLAAAPTAGTPAPAAARRGPRYSIIRVATAEPTAPRKPLIVEEAPLGGYTKPRTSAAPKTFTDPDLAR